ncbi:MAG: hypothetical protein IJ012_03610 [Clostridia bacterium]|nr:hypothetical protein [Clostridia bacterium]
MKIGRILLLFLLLGATLMATACGRNELTYEEYLALSAEEQKAYMATFDSIDDFMEWVIEARDKYNAEHAVPEIGGDGDIDISDYLP